MTAPWPTITDWSETVLTVSQILWDDATESNQATPYYRYAKSTQVAKRISRAPYRPYDPHNIISKDQSAQKTIAAESCCKPKREARGQEQGLFLDVVLRRIVPVPLKVEMEPKKVE